MKIYCTCQKKSQRAFPRPLSLPAIPEPGALLLLALTRPLAATQEGKPWLGTLENKASLPGFVFFFPRTQMT